MAIEELAQLDALILEEKRTIAREYFSDTWDSAIAEGIEAEIMAEEIVRGVLLEIARTKGNHAVTKFLGTLEKNEARGDFLPDRILQ